MLIDTAQTREERPAFVAGSELAELLRDPMTQLLMAADRVGYREIEGLLQRTRWQLGLFCEPTSSLP